ncbi:MAG: hypothetical protein H3C68_06010 [Deltaproteobacteria bacterium]|nr:hypothetical protein [Deltaproteobacteria bacterium]MBZ0220284.1 hypothetical protein [Deltaproteobacteria bacterium]
MSTNRAIVVNKELYNKPIADLHKTRVRIKLYLPPSDIPKTISPNYNKNEDRLTITFDYIDSEKEKELLNRDGIKLIVGVYSGKPLRIEISNIKKERIDNVKLTNIIESEIGKLIDSKKSELEGAREKANLSFAEELLKSNAGILAQATL